MLEIIRLSTARLLGRSHRSLTVGVLFLLLLMGALWATAAKMPYIDTAFSYSADMQTTVSMYDSARNRFMGDEYWLTNYSLQRVDGAKNHAKLQSIIKSVPKSGGPGNTQTDSFSANANSGLADINNKQGYVLGPRNAKKDTSFLHRYAPYDTALKMSFDAEESLSGLKVYKYTGRLAGKDAVVRTVAGTPQYHEPTLQLWIEPRSGWLVKVQEDTAIYTVDTTTKQAHKVQNIVSSFTDASVQQHVKYAQKLKYHLEFALVVIPSILLVCTLLGVAIVCLKFFKISLLSVSLIASLELNSHTLLRIWFYGSTTQGSFERIR